MSLEHHLKALALEHGPLWFHGSPYATPLMDMGALWLADDLYEAFYYCNAEEGSVHVYTQHSFFPDLRQSYYWHKVCQQAKIDPQVYYTRHLKGRLDPDEQIPLLQAAHELGYKGLILQDRTTSPHASIASFSIDHLKKIETLQAKEVRKYFKSVWYDNVNLNTPVPQEYKFI